MRRGLLLAVSVLALATSRVQAQGNLPVPPGGDPALACGQNPNGRAYWTEYAFCDLPVLGPGKAKGLIYWSHGVSGDNPAYKSAAAPFLRTLALAGWDVQKINRNNLYERCTSGVSSCWSAGGVNHAADLIERGRAAQAAGYKRVIAAGQSFGGAISLEANARSPGLFYAVVATSPNHGSADGNLGVSPGGRSTILDRQLLDVVAAQKVARLVVVSPPHDILVSHRDGNRFGATLRDTLRATGLPFVEFDSNLPINGHGAGVTGQFAAWYGDCLAGFLDPGHAPAVGETVCKPPFPLPRYLIPADLKRPMPGSRGQSRWLGAWEGTFVEIDRNFMLVVEDIDSGTPTVVFLVGAGSKNQISMQTTRYRAGHVDGSTLFVDRGSGVSLTLKLSSDGQSASLLDKLPTASDLHATVSRVALP